MCKTDNVSHIGNSCYRKNDILISRHNSVLVSTLSFKYSSLFFFFPEHSRKYMYNTSGAST